MKLPNLHMLMKQKSPSLPRNLALGTFGELPVVLSAKVNLPYLLYSMTPRCCLLHLRKQNCLLKTLLRTLILMTQVFLYLFPSRTNLKLHITINPKMVKKVIMNLDLSKASGPDCIPVVVLKNCEPEISHILAEFFSICLKESCFVNVSGSWERSTSKTTTLLVFLLWLVRLLKKL